MGLSNLAKGYVIACSLLAVSGTVAEARIRCDHEFQVNSGERFVTPYCEDEYLAQVARSYGTRVTASELRNSEQRKEYICRFAGADIRVKSICDGYRYSRGVR